jgi:hypothetical protein
MQASGDSHLNYVLEFVAEFIYYQKRAPELRPTSIYLDAIKAV